MTLPGPYTLSGRLTYGPGQVYPHRNDAAEAFVPILRAELEGLVAAGATFIQIDDPSPAIHPDAPSDFAALFNAAVAPVRGSVRLGAHLCFGNYLGSAALARRTYRPVLEAMLRFDVDELVLEFANREMAEVEILGEIAAAGRDVAAGVIDVKNYAPRNPPTRSPSASRRCLPPAFRPERLTLVPDCGFSQTARVGDDREASGAGRRTRPGARSPAPARLTEGICMDGHAISMLGTGLIGDFYTNTLHGQRGRDRVRIVYSRSAERGEAFRDRWDIPEATTDLAAAVDHPDTDVVVVALPNFLHEEAVGLAAKAGKAILCTKPLGRTAEEARRMLEVVEAAGVFGGYLEDLCYTPKTLKADRVGRGPGRSATSPGCARARRIPGRTRPGSGTAG